MLDRRPIISGRFHGESSGRSSCTVGIPARAIAHGAGRIAGVFFRCAKDRGNAPQWNERDLSPLAGCLAFALQQSEVDAIIVGANTSSEVDEIIATACGTRAVDFELPPLVETIYLDPSRWPAFAH
jgi:hypothetical protein